jgi:hypothetical protein
LATHLHVHALTPPSHVCACCSIPRAARGSPPSRLCLMTPRALVRKCTRVSATACSGASANTHTHTHTHTGVLEVVLPSPGFGGGNVTLEHQGKKMQSEFECRIGQLNQTQLGTSVATTKLEECAAAAVRQLSLLEFSACFGDAEMSITDYQKVEHGTRFALVYALHRDDAGSSPLFSRAAAVHKALRKVGSLCLRTCACRPPCHPPLRTSAHAHPTLPCLLFYAPPRPSPFRLPHSGPVQPRLHAWWRKARLLPAGQLQRGGTRQGGDQVSTLASHTSAAGYLYLLLPMHMRLTGAVTVLHAGLAWRRQWRLRPARATCRSRARTRSWARCWLRRASSSSACAWSASPERSSTWWKGRCRRRRKRRLLLTRYRCSGPGPQSDGDGEIPPQTSGKNVLACSFLTMLTLRPPSPLANAIPPGDCLRVLPDHHLR